MRKIIRFFDKLEDKVRGKLSRFPIIYGIVGGIGTVVFWRGVWHTTDYLSAMYVIRDPFVVSTIDLASLWDGLLSLLVGIILLLITGLFVSEFIGSEIIISGLRGEKRLSEKTEAEIKTETGTVGEIYKTVREISLRLDDIEGKIGQK